ncbi:LRR receptor-like serine/threonine-protein kinase ERECTA [Geodia barretti]|uniref:LRR receptor-like serine/threonine-protein kinase ERECTA n=1 Tax=Geodia barretti TaxID=519541 RepID=A0AA35TSZ4_GEOBA|nr:LRR receptor-like serine/threonine-protein kinase ERECTA [Geodia barretti]
MGGAEGAAEQNDAEYGAGQNDQTSDAISVSGRPSFWAIVSPTADLSGVNLVFSIAGTDSGKYRIDPMTGELFTAQWIDYETDAIDMFTVVVSEDSVSTLSVSKANPVPGVYQGNPEHALDDPRPDNFVETGWANWGTILRIVVRSESPDPDCGTGLDCIRLYVAADGSEDEQELVAMRTGAPGYKFVAAVKLVETEAAGGETLEVIGADGTARQVQVLQLGEDDEVEIEFDNLRGSVDVENGPPEFTYFQPDHGSAFDDQDVDFSITVQDAESGLPEPEDLPDRDGDQDYTPVAALVHDSQCYNSSQDEDGFAAVENLRLRDGAIYCFGQPEIHPIRDDRDFDEIDNGYDVETTIVLPEGEIHYVTFVVCDRSGNCIAYDADEDSDIALVELTPEQDDPCLATITDDSTIEGNWDGTCPSGREPEPYGGSGDRYARYYTFTLSATSNTTIALTSSDYYYSQKTGEFTLEVSGISKPPEDADCSSGIAVTDPDDNPGLVSDCEVLLAARDILAGSAGLNWSADIPIEEWDGIRIVGSPERVDSLTLNDLGLNGVIPAELGLLAHLFLLSLSGNDLSGPIPSELGDLGDLAILSLSGNNLNGAIPHELGDIPYLTILDLSSNQLTGEIPPELGKLTDLLELHLDRNQLVDVIPDELAELENLQSLYLAGNDLTGCIPDGLKDIDASDYANLGLLFCDGTPVVPLPSDPCVVDMGDFESRLEVIDNFWEEQCESTNRPDDGEYYARFFTFDLSVEADVTITLESNPDAYLYLLEGDGQRGSVLFEDDDTEGTNPRIRTTLQPGSYTVEATTYEIGVTTGDFRIGVETDELNGRPPITAWNQPQGFFQVRRLA